MSDAESADEPDVPSSAEKPEPDRALGADSAEDASSRVGDAALVEQPQSSEDRPPVPPLPVESVIEIRLDPAAPTGREAKGDSGQRLRRRRVPADQRVPFPTRRQDGKLPTPWCVYVLTFIYTAIHMWRGQADVRSDLIFMDGAHDRVAVWNGEYARLLTSTFLHGDRFHLLVNLLGLVYVGRHVERWLGPGMFFLCYFLTAIGGSLFFQAASGLNPGVGASGGIMGLIGIYFVTAFVYRRPTASLGRRFWIFLSVMVALIWVDGFLGGAIYSLFGDQDTAIAVSAHLGGFVAGLVVGYWAALRRLLGKHRRVRWAGVSVIAMLGLTAVYALAYPAFNWTWYSWRAKRAVAEKSEHANRLFERSWSLGGDVAILDTVQFEAVEGDPIEALEIWRTKPDRRGGIWRFCGAEALLPAFAHNPALAEEILELMIASCDEALEKHRSAALLNEAAWFRALKEDDLELALRYAQEAFSAEKDPTYQHTLGWIQFLLDDAELAMKNLRESAESIPFLYSYLAYAQLSVGLEEEAMVSWKHARKHPHDSHSENLMQQVQKALRITSESP